MVILSSVSIALVILILAAPVRLFEVPTAGMAPTIKPGDGIIVNGMGYRLHGPRVGDVAAFHTRDVVPHSPNSIFVQRIVAGPGDRVRTEDGMLYVNEQPVTYRSPAGIIIYDAPSPNAYMPYRKMTVASGHYYMLGDNPMRSSDSRFWGTVPAKNFIGRATHRYAPPERVGAIK